MSTENVATDADDAELEKADREAVMRHVLEGASIESDVTRRVRARAERITEEVYRTHGLLDNETIHNLLRGDEEDDVRS
jgi:hypothetical protein